MLTYHIEDLKERRSSHSRLDEDVEAKRLHEEIRQFRVLEGLFVDFYHDHDIQDAQIHYEDEGNHQQDEQICKDGLSISEDAVYLKVLYGGPSVPHGHIIPDEREVGVDVEPHQLHSVYQDDELSEEDGDSGRFHDLVV